MEKDRIDLNDYHKQQSLRLAKELSGQSLMSSEAFTKQVKRTALFRIWRICKAAVKDVYLSKTSR